MAIRKTSAIRHISYEELDEMLRRLAERVLSSGKNVSSVSPASDEDAPIAAILSRFLNVPLTYSGVRVGLYSELLPEICLFKIIYDSDFYNNHDITYLEVIEAEEDKTYQKITMPWRK